MGPGTAPLIETDTSARGQIITGDQTKALPLNGREYSSLALLTTGVRLSALNNNQAGTPREGSLEHALQFGRLIAGQLAARDLLVDEIVEFGLHIVR